MIDSKKYIRNIIAFVLAFALFILALYVFFTFTENKEKDSYYKPTVDKNVENSQYNGQTYTNQKYNFQITFPKNWDVFTGNNPHILQKAESGESSVYVSIYEFDKNLFKKFDNFNSLTIKDFFTADEYKLLAVEGIKQANSNLQGVGVTNHKFLEYFDTEINGVPAYGSKSSYFQIKDGTEKDYINISYDLMLGSIKYSITGIATAKNFTSVENEILNSIMSFKFLN